MLPLGILVDREQAGHAAALLELAAHQVAGALGRHHEHVELGLRHDALEVNVEAVRERQILAVASCPAAISRW